MLSHCVETMKRGDKKMRKIQWVVSEPQTTDVFILTSRYELNRKLKENAKGREPEQYIENRSDNLWD